MKSLVKLFFFIVITYSIGYGQTVDVKLLENLKMRSIGPAGMSGRVTAIDVNLRNPEHIYIGTASGGVWTSTSGGIDWEPIFDKERLQSIGALAINQQNPSEIWVGTGEGNPRNSMNSGSGIYKSLDGGRTWMLMGLEKTKIIHRIIIHPHNSDIVYIGAMGSAWGNNEERGVYKTADGGKTWNKILYVNDKTGPGDMVMDPSNPNKLLVGMWEYGRTPWDFVSGGPGSGLYLTYDGGENWKKITAKEGIPKGDLGRMGLAFAPSRPNIVYALIEARKNGLYKSTDGGEKWTLVASKGIGNRPFYYADIFVDPQNENRIYNLYSMVDLSEDGGKTFRTLLPYSGVHPDHHAFWIHPENPNYIIDGNDGGLNISRDRGETWRFISNLPLAQFYHINYDLDIPYNVYGGLQDNGSWIGPGYLWQRGGIRNHEWQELYFGDGFDVLPRIDNSRYGYAMSQGGNLGYYDRETGRVEFIKPVHPEGVKLRFNWNAAIAQNPSHKCGVYYGSQYVHKSMDCGQSWEIISPDLTTNDSTKQQQHKSGGLTIDATNAENHTTILVIEPSKLNEQVIWVGTDDGNLQLTRDGGTSWTNLSSRLTGLPQGSWIPQIVASNKNPGEVFVVANNYRRNDWNPYAYHTKDFGETWRRIVTPDQVDAFVLSIAQDPEVPQLLFLGTDWGLYISFDEGNSWQKWMHGFPSVQTSDLKIHPREGDLILGTFGRSVYVLDDIRPLREIARDHQILEKELILFPPPDAHLASFKSYDGMHFPADGEFSGSNRGSNGRFTVWVKPKEMKQAAKKSGADTDEDDAKQKKKSRRKAAKPVQTKIDSIAADSTTLKKENGSSKNQKPEAKMYILQKADTIRTLSHKLKPGMNRITWNLERNGVVFPNFGPPRTNNRLPGGPTVLPGEYQVHIHYNGQKDSTMIQVRLDPRASYSREDLEEKEAAYEAYNNVVKTAAQTADLITQAERTVKLVNSSIVNLPDSTQKLIKKRGKEISKEINELREIFVSPRDFKGIDGTERTLSKLYRVRSYLSGIRGKPGKNALNALDIAKTAIEEVADKVNAFYEITWAEYRKLVENYTIPLFKEYELIR